MTPLLIFCLSLLTTILPLQQETAPTLTGAWETDLPNGVQGLLILDKNFFSLTYYKKEAPEFISTEGGRWSRTADGALQLQWEYNTQEPAKVGRQTVLPLQLGDKGLSLQQQEWKRVDEGSPGALAGAWLITGRMRDGELSSITPGARKTMKILSGTRFQWIAYNSETGEFFGTGGGRYSTKEGKYTENIDFFSRDNSRVGASLEFEYEKKAGKWHHSGFSSKGDPIYEIWSTRQSIGI